MFIVHKVPSQEQKNAFSATLFSGAKYTYYQPEEFPEIVSFFNNSMELLLTKLDATVTPLIWTGDFLLGDKVDAKDTYVLNEINCSCVGFTSELDKGIQDEMSLEVIRNITKAHK